MKLTEISLKRPVTVCMFVACLTLIGVMGGRQLPLEFLPDIEFPGLFIQIPYRNSTPEEGFYYVQVSARRGWGAYRLHWNITPGQ